LGHGLKFGTDLVSAIGFGAVQGFVGAIEGTLGILSFSM
jgi:hypothetical protein